MSLIFSPRSHMASSNYALHEIRTIVLDSRLPEAFQVRIDDHCCIDTKYIINQLLETSTTTAHTHTRRPRSRRSTTQRHRCRSPTTGLFPHASSLVKRPSPLFSISLAAHPCADDCCVLGGVARWKMEGARGGGDPYTNPYE